MNVSGTTIVQLRRRQQRRSLRGPVPVQLDVRGVVRRGQPDPDPEGPRVVADGGQPERRLLGEPLRRLQGPPRLHRRRLCDDDVRHRGQLEGQHDRQRGLPPLHPALVRRRPDLDHAAGGLHPLVSTQPGRHHHGDGTNTCEWYGGYTEDDYSVCTTYGAGEFEQARNVSQLAGTKVTVLDPRYSPTGGMLKKDYTNLLCDDPSCDGIWENCGYTEAHLSRGRPRPVRLLRHLRDRRQHGGDGRDRHGPAGHVLQPGLQLRRRLGRAGYLRLPILRNPGIQVPVWSARKVKSNCAGTGWRTATTWRPRPACSATRTATASTRSGTRSCRSASTKHGEEIYTNMDSQFRRIFFNFNTDVAPTASRVRQLVPARPIGGGCAAAGRHRA